MPKWHHLCEKYSFKSVKKWPFKFTCKSPINFRGLTWAGSAVLIFTCADTVFIMIYVKRIKLFSWFTKMCIYVRSLRGEAKVLPLADLVAVNSCKIIGIGSNGVLIKRYIRLFEISSIRYLLLITNLQGKVNLHKNWLLSKNLIRY